MSQNKKMPFCVLVLKNMLNTGLVACNIKKCCVHEAFYEQIESLKGYHKASVMFKLSQEPIKFNCKSTGPFSLFNLYM